MDKEEFTIISVKINAADFEMVLADFAKSTDACWDNRKIPIERNRETPTALSG